MYRNIKYTIYVLSAFCLLTYNSCTSVDLCEVEQHPHVATLALKFDWGEHIPEDKPDSMLVIANRIINTWRAGFVVETSDSRELIRNGKVMFGQLIYEMKEEDATSEEEQGDEVSETETGVISHEDIQEEYEGDGKFSEDTSYEDMSDDSPANGEQEDLLPLDANLIVKGGEYQFIAINHNYEECGIERLEEFQTDLTVTARELYVKYKTDDEFESFGRSWVDYNPYGKYMKSAMLPTYYAFLPKEVIRSGVECEVPLSPHPITQQYTIRFKVEKEAGVKIDTIIGILSGIPERFELTTQYVDVSRTNKMVFVPHADYDSSKDVEVLECEGLVNAVGLLRANNPGYNQGPGILQLCIYTNSQRDGIPVSKTIYAIINLYNTIGRVRPLISTLDGEHVQQNGREIVLDISNVLHIKKDEVLEDTNKDNALDTWQKVQNFEIDI